MAPLQVYLFGPLEIVRERRTAPEFPTRKSRDLFSYLALHRGRLYPREVLASVFWGECPDESARKCLRTELWRVRKTLESLATARDVLLACNGRVGLHGATEVWVDVAEFQAALAPLERTGGVATPAESRTIERALDLYRGDLLEGNFEDWCLETREALKRLLLSALEALMDFHCQRREWAAAAGYGSKALSHDPLAEHVHRRLMRCYWEMGNRVEAVRQYRRCAELLQAELDVAPMRETSELFQHITGS